MMEEMVKRYQIPAFGNWDYCDELPITQYFESAMQAGLIRGHYLAEDADLFKPLPPVAAPALMKPHYQKRKAKRDVKEQQKNQQSKVCDVNAQAIAATPRRRPRISKAVDEDLYKIPPELLYQKPKRKRLIGNFWKACLGLNCIS